jgi:TolB-like protein
METDADNTQIARFGPFEVNLRTGELRKRGFRISLQEQPLRILCALLEASGEIVTRQELCRRLWPDGTFVDFEHSLNAAVRRLRVSLGDDAGIPRFIETMPRRGYRFLAMNGAFPRPARRTAEPRVRFRLAVIPFAVLSAGESADGTAACAFVDGLVDEAITQLARKCPDHVGVMARTSVIRLTGTDRSAGDLGRTLGAEYLVEGSVRREGARVRITAQLIDAEDETHLWAATFDRTLADPLNVQTEVAESIAAGVVSSLGAGRQAAVGF